MAFNRHFSKSKHDAGERMPFKMLLARAAIACVLTGCDKPTVNPSEAKSATSVTSASLAEGPPMHNSPPRDVVGSVEMLASNGEYPEILDETWLTKASLSFSPIPFETRLGDIQPLLSPLREDDCERADSCTFLDENGVEHYFWEDDNLVLKIVNVKRFIGRPISALGIGLSRSQNEVVRRSEAFFGGTKLECRPDNEYGAGSVCTISLGEGWASLFFDKQYQLFLVKLDAYQFT